MYLNAVLREAVPEEDSGSDSPPTDFTVSPRTSPVPKPLSPSPGLSHSGDEHLQDISLKKGG